MGAHTKGRYSCSLVLCGRAPAVPLIEPLTKLVDRHRSGEPIPLDLVAPHIPENIQLCLVLDAFGDGVQAHLLRQFDGVPDDDAAFRIGIGGTDEGPTGLRAEGGDGFYAAYFRDLDGNKLDVFSYG